MLFQITLLALVASAFAGPISQVPLLDGRIVGGVPADINDFPYQLSLQYYSNHICGASIIASNIALTAAHCTDGSPASKLSVRAGSSIRGSGGHIVQVARIIQHPSYNRITVDYDISVLVLSENLLLGKAINLLNDNEVVPEGTPAIVSGWGTLSEGGSSTSQLQAVSLNVISHASCKAVYNSSPKITDRMLCAGGEGGKDSCQGDSGGPFVSGNTQVGVVSWGYGCARSSYPGVYSSVANLRSWIRDVSGV